jgi:hypothetical protein
MQLLAVPVLLLNHKDNLFPLAAAAAATATAPAHISVTGGQRQ